MRLAIVLSLCIVLSGCATTYYQIHDPSTSSTYYTTEYEDQEGGAVSLKDDRTNAQVTVQNSEIMEITEDQYGAAIRTIEVAPSAERVPTAPITTEPTDSESVE